MVVLSGVRKWARRMLAYQAADREQYRAAIGKWS